ncbi:glutathione-disulfide reductase [Methyloligella sp. 2.7D]|uniref:glutathione-disulfide reductase n=1 Tax=unclassified Methyloligella TaxID=2625955 RepID=UPI00157BBD61|nr:glutathione-disulfide reductase [Methyloligella sp. GL2]QKP77190.1 glutathione-disulfide reductase [Methyloligella sp. GL2]
MADYDYDLFVIGAGSGGVRAARLAAECGAKVAIAEEYRVGGTCVIRGCVPKKLLVYGARISGVFADAPAFGWEIDGYRFDWPTLIGNVQAEVDRLNGIYTRLLENSGVTSMLARATVEGPHTIRLSDRDETVTAKRILVATGGHPMIPDIPGREHFITSDDCFKLEALPSSLAVLGAGYIGLEFASIFAALGVNVTVIYRGDQILRGFDDEVRDQLADALRARGIDIRVETNIERIEEEGGKLRLHLTRGDSLLVEKAMAATGRIPNTVGLGLEHAGVELGWNGHVVVNEYSQSAVESIYAVGDATDRINLTPVAIREAHAFSETVFHDNPTALDYENVPTAAFTTPEAAMVGLTEAEARERCEVDIYKTSFTPMTATLPKRTQKMLLKLIVDAESDRVLGCHVLGPDAAEIIQVAAIAVTNGLTKAQFDRTVALHPTASEELVTMRHKWEPPVVVAGSDAAA